MLTSSSEYLEALREGKYLLFLEWVDFISKKYSDEKNDLGAEAATNLLVFEWLNNGYTEEDGKKLALLHAVHDLESKSLQGKLDYSFQTILIALFSCMIFRKHNLHLHSGFLKATGDEINQLIEKSSAQLQPQMYQSSLAEIQIEFFKWVESMDRHEVKVVFHKIYEITRPRYLLEDYILHLERLKIQQDDLYTARLSMARSFLGYLYEQVELTSKISEEITNYVNALRELHPGKWEEELLDAISPPSTLDSTFRWVTKIGINFFNSVLNEKSIGELISGKSETPRI